MAQDPGYISVRNWRRFQHYDPATRTPPWIKNYAELLADDAYLALPVGTALILHRLWLAYASSRCRLRADSLSLTRRLGVRVTSAQLIRLSQAGFIDIVASAELADGYQNATPSRAREEVEVEVETPSPLTGKPVENRRRRTGYRQVRGSHGVSYVPDPAGTDPLPNGWRQG